MNRNKPEIKFNDELFLINQELEKNLDLKIDNITNFISNNTGRGKEDSIKDSLYIDAQKLWKEFNTELESVKYNFYLNGEQSKFLKDLLKNKLEYDSNTVFFAIELDSLINEIDNREVNYKAIELTSLEITYIYHLISQYKVKGITAQTHRFVEVLLLIGKISKIFDFYKTTLENLSTDITDWVTLFDESLKSDTLTSIEN